MSWWTDVFDRGVPKNPLVTRGPSAEVDADIFVRFARPKPSDAILDLACGNGSISIALAKRGLKAITAIDQSEHCLTAGRHRALRAKTDVAFVKSNPCCCPFPAGTFDSVAMLGNSFARPNDFRSDTAILREALRLLRPSGVFVLGVADGDWRRRHYEPDSVETLADGFIYRRAELSDDGNRLITHVLIAEQERGVSAEGVTVERLYGARQVIDLLRSAGFEAISLCQPDATRPAVRQDTAPRLYFTCRAPATRSASQMPLMSNDETPCEKRRA